MTLVILTVSLLGAYILVPQLDGSEQPFVLGLVFGLAALAVIVDGLTTAYHARQARLRDAARAESGNWPADSEPNAADALMTKAVGGDKARADRD